MKRAFKLLLTLSAMTILVLMISVSAFAAPAYGGGVQYTQPSGQTFTASTGGDEWFNYTASSTGYLIEKGSDGYWYYTTADKDGTVKPGTEKFLVDAPPADALTTADVSRLRELKLSTYQSTGPSKAPQFGPQQAFSLPSPTGTQKILVLLVSFTDKTIVNTETAWSNAFFGGSGSVASYYKEVSENKFTFLPAEETGGAANDGVVKVTLNYAHPNPGSNNGNDNRKIVADALAAANGSVNFASYDTNHSGYIEASELKIVTIVAGYERSYADASPSVWAHRWSLGFPYPYPNGTTVAAPLLDGVTLCDISHDGGYTQLGELHGTDAASHMATIGTICHEIGHDLGLPDLYDTVDGNGTSQGAGDFSLMGSGNWCLTAPNAPGSSPTHLDAWSKSALGWVTPTTAATGTHTLNSISSGYNVLKIPTSDSEEYFLLEFRGFNGYDAGLQNITTNPGIAVWHIDDGTIEANIDNNIVNGDATHKGVDLEEAGGSKLLDSDVWSQDDYLFRFGAHAEFGPTSPNADINSKLYNGTNTYINVRVTGGTATTSTVLLSSSDARMTAGTLAGQTISGTFTGGASIGESSALTVTVPYSAKTNAALALTMGNTNSTVKYVLSGTTPVNDAAYTSTYTAGSTNITVANGSVLWLLVTAEDTTTKLYYKITVTVPAASNVATITSGKLADQTISGTFTGGTSIGASSELTVTVPDASKTNAALSLTMGNTNSTVKYVLSASQPVDDAAYSGTYAAGSTNITVANGNVLWLLVTAEDTTTKLYYKISITVPSSTATITAGTLAGNAISGTFTGGANIGTSSALTVTIPDASKTNAALALTKGNANSTVKYVLSSTTPGSDAAYTSTYAAGSTNITVVDGNVLWLLVTAQDGSTKLYYKLTITVPSSNATITSGTLALQTISGTFTGGTSIGASSELTVTVPDASKTNAALSLTMGNTNSTVKYVLGGTAPANDAAYSNTYVSNSTTISVADGDVLWLLVTAQDTTTKRYYKITVTIPSNDAKITAGTLAGKSITGTFTGGANIGASSALTVTVPDADKANAALVLTKGDANSTIKYVLSTSQPVNDAAYTGTYSGSTNITVADDNVLWLLVTAEDTATKLYYKITVTVPSTNATITAGTLAGQPISGTFTGGGNIGESSALTVTVPNGAKTNAALALSKGNAKSTVKYILSTSQPADDAAYTSTYAASSTTITVTNGDILWLFVTAQDGSTKLYYKLTITVTAPSSIATISGGTLAGNAISGTFTGGADITASSALTVTIPDTSKTNAVLALTKGDLYSSVKYVKSTSQPANDAGYTGTYTAGSTSITVADKDVIWLLVTAENGTAKLYYKLTVTVSAPIIGGGGGGGGGETPKTNDTTSEFIKGDTLNVSIGATVTTNSGTTNATISTSGLDALISHATAATNAGKNAALEVRITGTEKSDSVNLTMTGKQFSDIAGKTEADFSVTTGIGTVTFGNTAVNAISSAAGGKDVTISIDKVNPSTLSADARNLVNDRPVYNFSVKAGSSPISSFEGSSVTVSVPYTLKPGEDPNNIVVYYISDSGVLTAVNTSVYDPATGTVSFITDHFSKYAVAYKDIRFNDVSGWYADSVNYLAARGIVGGVGGNLFKPEDKITRAQFVTMLANISGDDLSTYNSSSFSDVKTTDWYSKTVQWAYEHKIVMGAADKFSPNDFITRQDIVTILQRYADSTGYKLPETTVAKALTDGDKIAPYAANAVAVMQRAGIISGMSDGRFAPTSSATRSEAAKMLAVFMKDMFI